MWLKCGTKILNEIKEVKKSAVFFGSGIYPKNQLLSVSSACVSFALRSAVTAPKP